MIGLTIAASLVSKSKEQLAALCALKPDPKLFDASELAALQLTIEMVSRFVLATGVSD